MFPVDNSSVFFWPDRVRCVCPLHPSSSFACILCPWCHLSRCPQPIAVDFDEFVDTVYQGCSVFYHGWPHNARAVPARQDLWYESHTNKYTRARATWCRTLSYLFGDSGRQRSGCVDFAAVTFHLRTLLDTDNEVCAASTRGKLAPRPGSLLKIFSNHPVCFSHARSDGLRFLDSPPPVSSMVIMNATSSSANALLCFASLQRGSYHDKFSFRCRERLHSRLQEKLVDARRI